MSLKCRYYENELPEIGDVVVVNVKSIQAMGAYVSLLEYQNIEGMILLSELSRRRIRSVNKLLRVGRNEVVSVIRVDADKKYIDLSKRQVSAEEISRCDEKFANAKAVNQILRRLAEELNFKTDEEFEDLYNKTAWHFDRKYNRKGASYDVFKQAVTNSEVLDECDLDNIVKEKLLADINRRMMPQAVKIRSDFDISCFTFEGIDAIKFALQKGLDLSSKELEIKINLIQSPQFMMTCQTLDKSIGLSTLNEAIQAMKEAIESKGGSFKIIEQPRVVSDHDELNLKKRLAELEEANNEVSGDDSVSEDEESSAEESGTEEA